MLQWWHETQKHEFGVVCEATWAGETARLVPKYLHRVNDNGAIQNLAVLSAEELKWMRQSSGELVKTAGGLTGVWHGPDGATGTMSFAPPQTYPDTTVSRCRSWAGFKVWADKVRADRSAEWFRGHGSSAFPLRTTIHRVGRCRLERYCYLELVRFQGQAEAAFNRRFDMNNTMDYSTVMGLARHHGVPTPLLDWTASPYSPPSSRSPMRWRPVEQGAGQGTSESIPSAQSS
jgi:hypothetical protein